MRRKLKEKKSTVGLSLKALGAPLRTEVRMAGQKDWKAKPSVCCLSEPPCYSSALYCLPKIDIITALQTCNEFFGSELAGHIAVHTNTSQSSLYSPFLEPCSSSCSYVFDFS